MGDDLVTWLRAQLDDDERVAHRVDPNQAPDQLRAMVTREGSLPFLVVDSARVLAEVDAKRRLLDWLERRDDWALDNNLWTWDSAEAVALLALPYADREGYRDEWRPVT